MPVKISRHPISNHFYSNVKLSIDWLPGYFKGEDVFLVGGGPSLEFAYRKGCLRAIESRRRIVINHSYLYCKPEILLFLDAQFKKEFEERGHDWNAQGRILAGPTSGMRTGGNVSVFHIAQEVSRDSGWLFGRAQSGLAAINAALIGGAERIFLLGFDCKFDKGKGHFYSGEWVHKRDGNEEAYRRGIEFYKKYYCYKNIFNCSTNSVLKFPYVDLNQILSC